MQTMTDSTQSAENRRCAICAVPQPKSDYSKAQWAKKKNGHIKSKCKSCVDRINKKRSGANLSAAGNVKKHRKAKKSRFPVNYEDLKEQRERRQKKQAEEDAPKIQHRLDNPDAPPHPDMQKSNWKHSQTMTVTSGRICFGFNHEVREGANEEVMTFEDAVVYYSDRHAAAGPHNTVAKNGTWVAYKLIDRDTRYDEYYPNRTDDDRIAGWFICHESIQDPVAEVCNMVYNTFNSDNGGNYLNWLDIYDDGKVCGVSNNTHPFHADLGYVLLARYSMGYNMPLGITEEEEDAICEKGLFVVDYAVAQGDESSWSENGICNMCHIVGRLAYDENEECKAFLIAGDEAPFQYIHFTTEGTTPLGREYEDWDNEDAESVDGSWVSCSSDSLRTAP